MKPSRPTALFAALIGGALLSLPAAARSLDAIKASGTIAVCANPNALPFARRKGPTHGFQLDLAAALARRLGVSLTPAWVISRYDMYRAPCDIVMESIADAEVQAQSGIRLSKPYRHSGVMLAVRPGDHTRSLADLKRGHKTVGVLVSSLAAMMLNQHGIETAPAVFEDDLLEMLEKHEVDEAAVTAASVGYYNLRHPKAKLRLVDLFESDPDLSWNVAVGMRKSDPALIQAVDTAMAQLEADGTVKRIYAKYGITVQPPR